MTVERMLPTPEALRTILDVTVHADECEKVLRAYVEGRLIDGQAIADALTNSIVSGFYCTTHKAIGREFACEEWLDGKKYRPCTMVEYVGYPKSFVDALTEEE